MMYCKPLLSGMRVFYIYLHIFNELLKRACWVDGKTERDILSKMYILELESYSCRRLLKLPSSSKRYKRVTH